MRTLVVAPHADDELLGCGGTLLRRRAAGGIIGWILVTSDTQSEDISNSRNENQNIEINKVREGLGVSPFNFYHLSFPTTRLSEVPMNRLIDRFSQVFVDFLPYEVLLPHAHDVHSDHRIVFDAASACTKCFRYPSVKRVLSYETLSEADYNLKAEGHFRPNFFVDITDYMATKLELLRYYSSELGDHPFPRSEVSVEALGILRGSQSGFRYAEAFQLLRERI